MKSINHEIFTCDKTTYFDEATKKWDTKKVVEFWAEIRKYINQQSHEQVIEFINFIFPAFEEHGVDEDEDENGPNYKYIDGELNFLPYPEHETYTIQSLLSFENCIFLTDINFGSIYDYGYNYIHFQECEFKGECELSNNVKVKSLSFIDNKKIIINKNISVKANVEDLTINGMNIETLSLSNLQLAKSLKITNTKLSTLNILNNTWQNANVLIEQIFCDNIIVKNNKFNDTICKFDMLNGNFSNAISLKIITSNFSHLIIQNGLYSLIDFIRCDFNKIWLTAINEGCISFNNTCRFEDEALINFTNVEEFNLTNSFIDGSLSINANESENGSLYIDSCIIKQDSIIDLSNLIFQKIHISELQNLGASFSINLTEVKDNLILHDSNFKDSTFNNMNISKCSFDFKNIAVNNMEFNNVDWGHIKPSRFGDDTKRDTFTQLKYAHDKIGNIINANKFYAIEMSKAQKEFEYETTNNLFHPKKSDLAILNFHQLFSNYSQSFILPFLWIIIISMNMALIQVYFNAEIKQADQTKIYSVLFGLNTIILSIVLYQSKLRSKYINCSAWRAVTMFIFIFAYLYIFHLIDIPKENFLYPLNLIAIQMNPIKLFKADYIGYQSFALIGKVLIGYLIYQMILAIRQNTRRK